jgi:hypothetical protein
MRVTPSFLTAITFAIAASELTYGASLSFSTSGSFAAGDFQDALVTPGATWQLSFKVDSPPSATNAGLDGLDIGFGDFSYLVNNSPVAATPQSIRFYQAANNGLFTVFFGSESGADARGNFIPEFSFSGPVLFSGSSSDPSIASGGYPIAEMLYTDASNYDDQVNAGVVTVATSIATPEPVSAGLLLLGGCAAMLARLRVPKKS